MLNTIKEIINFKDSSLIKYKIGMKWKEIVGEFLCKSSSPAYFKSDILYVYTFSSTWIHHLNLNKKKIIEEIKDKTNIEIKEIKFLIGKRETKFSFTEETREEKNNIGAVILDKNTEEEIVKISSKIENKLIKEKFKNFLITVARRKKFFEKSEEK